MSELKRIKSELSVDLSPEFLASDRPSELRLHGESFSESIDRVINLEQLDEVIVKLMKTHPRESTAIDLDGIVDIHRALLLTRREAADQRVWGWLGVVKYPDFVAWRWKVKEDGLRTAARFYGDRVRQTFSRAWWAAELTVNGDDYSLTIELLQLPGFQDVYETVFGRAFGNHRPAMKAFVNVYGRDSEALIRKAAVELGYRFSTIVIEAMEEDELSIVMKDVRNRLLC